MAAATEPMPPLGMDRASPAKTIEEKEKRVGRTGAKMGAQHRIEGNGAFQAVILQFIVEHIGHIDQHEAHEFTEVVAAETANFQSKASKFYHFIANAFTKTRRCHAFEGAQYASKTH